MKRNKARYETWVFLIRNSVSDVLLKSRPSEIVLSVFLDLHPPTLQRFGHSCLGVMGYAPPTSPSPALADFPLLCHKPCSFPRGLCPRASPPETPCLPACHPVASKQTSGRCFGTFCWQAFSTLPQSSSPPCSYSTLCVPPSPACSSLPGPHFSGDTEHLRCTGGGCH